MEAEAKLFQDIERTGAETSLTDFVRHGWQWADPSEYIHNWHIELLSDALEDVSRGALRRVIINIPPRHMKSLECAVFWPAWDWIDNPGRRWLFASYAQSLSVRDSVKCRRLIESPWYQGHWGDRYTLTSDQNTKIRFDNSAGGYRLSTSVGGTATGEGGDFIVIDDPHNVKETESELVRQGALEWWDQVMSTRLNNPKTGAYIVVMQRVHEKDLTGHILARNTGWEHICLPARYEDAHPHRYVMDPRKIDGSLLWPQRVGEAELRELEISLAEFGAAGQLQQRPSPKGGGILRRAWWKDWDKAEPPRCSHVILSMDTAFSEEDKKSNSYSAATIWGVFGSKESRTDGRDETIDSIILLDSWMDRVDYPDLKKQAFALIKKYDPDSIMIEKKASGQSLIQDLRRSGIPIIAYDPGTKDKPARAYEQQSVLSSGQVYAPLDQTFARLVVDQCASFPGAHDDLVDTALMAWKRFREMGLLRLGSDSWEEPEPEKVRKETYSPYA